MENPDINIRSLTPFISAITEFSPAAVAQVNSAVDGGSRSEHGRR